MAEARYAAALEGYQVALTKAECEFENRLRVPEDNIRLGLPAGLPESTIRVLSRTQALSQVAPTLPKRSDYFGDDLGS
jgi:hypothetical protein